MVTVGIDLGTTRSCVATFRNGKVEIIPNEQGDVSTPSYVSYSGFMDKFVGDEAKGKQVLNPEGTIYDSKRCLGRKLTDTILQADMKEWPFSISDHFGLPRIAVPLEPGHKIISVEEVSATILQRLRETAELYLGCQVTDAVVSVPSFFNDAQRQATLNAGLICGLNVMRLINETTASAIAYGLDKKFEGENHILVYDLGGGCLDVSVVSIDDGIFEVVSTSGFKHLGGRDFDSKLVEYLVGEFQRKFVRDIRGNRKAMCRLRAACERAKCALSSSKQANIELDGIIDGVNFYTSVTRELFEALNHELFARTLEAVNTALRNAKKTPKDIHDVVLVGGSTRIPMIQRLLRDLFGRELSKSVNPDEAVAYGAAVQAAILKGNRSKALSNVLLIDVTPRSIGIETAKGAVTAVIARNASLPISYQTNFTTCVDNAPGISLKVFEENELLCTYDIGEIRPAAKGTPSIQVTFSIDANGILTVKAVNNKTRGEMSVRHDKFQLSLPDLKCLRGQSEVSRMNNMKQRGRTQAKYTLESYALEVRDKLASEKVSEYDRSRLLVKVNRTLAWLEANQTPKREDVEGIYHELVKACKPVIMRL